MDPSVRDNRLYQNLQLQFCEGTATLLKWIIPVSTLYIKDENVILNRNSV